MTSNVQDVPTSEHSEDERRAAREDWLGGEEYIAFAA